MNFIQRRSRWDRAKDTRRIAKLTSSRKKEKDLGSPVQLPILFPSQLPTIELCIYVQLNPCGDEELKRSWALSL